MKLFAKAVFYLAISWVNISLAVACETSYIRHHVTQNDKLNSRGVPLSDTAAFLQQDRYWLHVKNQQDQFDVVDYLTTTKEARAWYGEAVREHISPDAAFVATSGNFVAVVSYDTCSFINESGKRDVKSFINHVDIAPHESGFYEAAFRDNSFYQLTFRYVDAALASEITGYDEYQADTKSTEVYDVYMNYSGGNISAENAALSYIPNAEVFVLQTGACGQATCPFDILGINGSFIGSFESEYGFVYSENMKQKLLLTRVGEVLHEFQN